MGLRLMSFDPNNVRVLVRELIDDAGPAADAWVIRFTRPIGDDEIQELVNARLGPQRLVDNRPVAEKYDWIIEAEWEPGTWRPVAGIRGVTQAEAQRVLEDERGYFEPLRLLRRDRHGDHSHCHGDGEGAS